jgi:rhodanese-related sulfurtransferase
VKKLLLAVLLLAPLAAPAAEDVKLISTAELAAKLQAKAVVLVDSRTETEFGEGHIPGAVLVPAKQTVAKLGQHARKDQLVVFYCNGPDCTKSRKAYKAALAAGYGVLREYNDGLPAWRAAGKPVEGKPLPAFELPAPLPPAKVQALLAGPGAPALVDIRDADEFDVFHLKGARSIPLDELKKRVGELPPGPILLVDHAGHQVALAARVLASLGRRELRSLAGGVLAWADAGLPVEEK